jgi:hypothetical protein
MNEVAKYEGKGLTRKEVEILEKFIQDGKPGLTKQKSDRLGEIYILGYSCHDIHKWFPEFPIEIIVWSKYYYNWEEARTKYRESVTQETLQSALSAREDSLKFLTEMLTATHIKFRRSLLDYIARPESTEEPKILPKSIYDYNTLLQMGKEMTASITGKLDSGDPAATPLVSVTVNNGKEKPDIVLRQGDPKSVKDALIQDLAKGKINGDFGS